jgi:LysM repeat protein
MRQLRVILIAIIIFGATEVSAQFASRVVKSENIIHIHGTNYYIHNVAEGDTVYALSKLYGVSEDEIRQNNPAARESLSIGQVLKIPVQPSEPVNAKRQSRLFEEHTVRAGETAYSIARNYGISVSTLIEDNAEVDPTRLPIGQLLNIRKKEMGTISPREVTQQWEEYRDAANSVSDEYTYHIVKPGETIYSLSRMFDVPRQTLIDLNDLQEGLKANSIIRIPVISPDTTSSSSQDTLPENHTWDVTGFAEHRIVSKEYHPHHVPNIALMLPLEGSVASNSDFADFYRGTLLALEDLKTEGHSANVTLYNTYRSADKVRSIVSEPAFADFNLIIGPVYESAMIPAVQYADTHLIPIVSPLASIKSLDSPMLYQMAPGQSSKYDKLRGELTSGKNIILVSSGQADDREFEGEIVELLAGNSYGRFSLGMAGTDISTLIDWNRENIFVVLAGSEIGVDGALASISTAYNNASARTSRRADIKVIGSHRWAQYNSNLLDKTLFFKLNVCFVSSYYIDRTNSAVAKFEARFLEEYSVFPSRAAFRGYDALMLFVRPFFESGYTFEQSRSRTTDMPPLQMPYMFVQQGDETTRHTNNQWALVCFRSDYNIEVR